MSFFVFRRVRAHFYDGTGMLYNVRQYKTLSSLLNFSQPYPAFFTTFLTFFLGAAFAPVDTCARTGICA